jgi:hypothetical protein
MQDRVELRIEKLVLFNNAVSCEDDVPSMIGE